MDKVWLVTGCSRGFGRSLAGAVLRKGDRLVATARDPETLRGLKDNFGERVLPVRLDVTRPEQANAAIEAAIAAFGRLDVLVNNAGYGFMGAFEELSAAEFARQIETNFWGVVHMCRAAVPVMRGRGSGYVVQFSSVGGRQANPGFTAYQSAKFAVEGFSEALAQEIKPLGLRLTIVEPGGFRTDWGGASMSYAKPMPEYTPTAGAVAQYIRTHAQHFPGDPDKAADVILRLADLAEPPLRLPMGSDAVAILRSVYTKTLAELEQWAELSESTDFDGTPELQGEHDVLQIGA